MFGLFTVSSVWTGRVCGVVRFVLAAVSRRTNVHERRGDGRQREREGEKLWVACGSAKRGWTVQGFLFAFALRPSAVFIIHRRSWIGG